MLQLTPDQAEALENVEETIFHLQLAAHLTGQWPVVAERLGERLPAFVELAVRTARKHRLTIVAGIARYVSLCFVWGPGFEQKPGFEWARDALADEHRHEWLIVHQLVRRTIAALLAKPGSALPSAQALLDADSRLIQMFSGHGRIGRLLLREGLELPRVACDADAAEIRLVEPPARHEYQVSASGSTRVAAPNLPVPLRIDAKRAHWPVSISILADDQASGPPVRLQVRIAATAVCDPEWHPHVALATTHGQFEARGHEARAISWLLHAPSAAGSGTEPAPAIGEEAFPEVSRLDVTTCGLRDDGIPLAEGKVQVWVYPATQWLLELAHSGKQILNWPGPAAEPVGNTRVRLECDGVARDSTAWSKGFQENLGSAIQAAVSRLGGAWERTSGLSQAFVKGQASLLTGRAAVTWGWRTGDNTLSSKALLRFVADLDLMVCVIDLQMVGQLAFGSARATLRLQVKGESPLRTRISREGPDVELPVLMANAVGRFRIPLQLEVEPIATVDGAVLNLCGPCSGALVGEAGLRPRVAGGSGWQWYVSLRIEPAAVPVMLHDPLIGQTRHELSLLPALPLLDWSLG